MIISFSYSHAVHKFVRKRYPLQMVGDEMIHR